MWIINSYWSLTDWSNKVNHFNIIDCNVYWLGVHVRNKDIVPSQVQCCVEEVLLIYFIYYIENTFSSSNIPTDCYLYLQENVCNGYNPITTCNNKFLVLLTIIKFFFSSNKKTLKREKSENLIVKSLIEPFKFKQIRKEIYCWVWAIYNKILVAFVRISNVFLC